VNSDTGEIYKFDSKQSMAAKQAELQQAQQELIRLREDQAKVLEHFHPDERVSLHRELMSKNHSAKRRARKKIAKASRQRNRK